MKKATKHPKKTNASFYSTKGILTLIILLLSLSAISLWGMYTIGIIRLPSALSALFSKENTLSRPAGAIANIAPDEAEETLMESIPREEYTLALANMTIPKAYYRNYTITLSSGNSSKKTEYFAIQKGEDWWVQTAQKDVILTTAVCKDGSVHITDNAQNSSVTVPAFTQKTPHGVSFTERCGILTITELTEIIRRAALGEAVEYGGGIKDFSLSYTPSLGTSENLFSFKFDCENGITEEYTFAYESATILSVKKTFADKVIFRMELIDYRNTLDDIDTESLFTLQ